MKNPTDNYWWIRLGDLRQTLEANNFEVHRVPDAAAARAVVLDEIVPAVKPGRISWGGSETFVASGLYHHFTDQSEIDVLDTFDKKISREEMYERRRQALLVDLFLTGTNAITERGQLVNLDSYGNRVAAITWGPLHVVLLIGRNKLVPDLAAAFHRVRNLAAPINAMRLEKETPCRRTSVCEDCSSPARICNNWTITEKSTPRGRIKIILINQELGVFKFALDGQSSTHSFCLCHVVRCDGLHAMRLQIFCDLPVPH